jgi:2-dehydro-3-deoxygluconokinase
MLRLDPEQERITTTRSFRVWEGGGEYNVARSLKRCFGLQTSIVTALVDNPVGHLIQDLMYQGGVDQSHVIWRPFDGVGRAQRNGLNFTERGFGVRGAIGCSDRGHSAASQLSPGEVSWQRIFAEEGSRWFHCGGIFAALSETAPEVAREAMEAAREHRAVVSYDLNFRPSLWQGLGGRERARNVNRNLIGLADVLIGNEEDFTAALGFEVEGVGQEYKDLQVSSYARMMAKVAAEFPNLRVVACTLRTATTATRNDWTGVCYADGRLYGGRVFEDLEILDRVGGGDSFAAGLIFGLLRGDDLSRSLNLGIAHGALAMTTPGDTSMATLVEVERLLEGRAIRVVR